eukprot:6487-Heterococcus_DN1.PRE.1
MSSALDVPSKRREKQPVATCRQPHDGHCLHSSRLWCTPLCTPPALAVACSRLPQIVLYAGPFKGWVTTGWASQG